MATLPLTCSSVLLTVFTIICVGVLSKIVHIYYEKRCLKILLKDFPGEPPHWLWGNLRDLKRGFQGFRKQVKWRKKHGPLHVTWIGPSFAMLHATHPDYVKAILNTAEPKNPVAYNSLSNWIGDGLLVSKGEKWKRNRRLLTPAFHFEILKPYIGVFSDCVNVMVDKWRKELSLSSGDTCMLDMFEQISLMTLDSLLKCVMGYHGTSVQTSGEKNEYIDAVYQLSETAVTRLRSPFLRNDFVWKFHPVGRKWQRLCDQAHRFTQNIIEQKKKEMETDIDTNVNNNLANNNLRKRKCLDFIDMLLRARDTEGNGLSDTEIQHEMDTFMFEGHDTTASGISWCCYNLANNPEHQDRCRAEVNELLGDRNELTWGDMSKLPYLTQCIKESMRIHPPVPNVSRTITQPIRFPDGRVVQPGTIVNLSIWQVHHNEEVWSDPERFDPDRFSVERASERSSHDFIGFSAGPRNCIGQQFAMNELKTSMALVLKNFRLSVVPDRPPEPLPELILRAKDGLWLNVEAL